MKVLYICRHAKSSWQNSNLSDFERPLNERGLKTAPKMAKYLSKQQPLPDTIITSTAQRALHTANIYNEELNINLKKEKDLYHIDYMELFHYICSLPAAINSVAIVGHNPGLTNIVNYLTGADIYNIATAGIAAIKFNINHWNEISGQTGELLWYQYPKGLD